jgi:hypothetical protein
MGFWDTLLGLSFIGVGAYLVASQKDRNSPNYTKFRGFGIFFIVIGSLIFTWNITTFILKKLYIRPTPQVVQNPLAAPSASAVVNPNGNMQVAIRNNNIRRS